MNYALKWKQKKPVKMHFTGFHLFTYQNNNFDTLFVGVAGFEPATSASQTRRDNRATLHPDFGYL